ncbi:MAG TPA: hypothetical protein VFV38_42245 [Ktedonobacteraceae bacterium]|nr:hypothetical protein [Ktedonobacteraceae bacterium]
MPRLQGYMLTIIGCLLALLSFTFLPYIVITFPNKGTYALNGWQLLGSHGPSAIFDQTGAYNRIQLSWLQPVLITLLLLCAIIQFVLDRNPQREARAGRRGALSVLIAGGLALTLLLCRYIGDMQSLVLLVPSTPVIQNPPEIAGTALYNAGFLGFLVGLALAFTGSVLAWRARR